MAILKANSALSAHITLSVVSAIDEAIKSTGLIDAVAGSMKYSIITDHSKVPSLSKKRLGWLLPEHFGEVEGAEWIDV